MKIQLFAFVSLSFFMGNCLADASFDSETNQLNIPFIHYQDQLYQADLTFLPPDKLKLEQVTPHTNNIPNTELVPVDADLNFHVSNISTGTQQYAADIDYLGDNLFQVNNLLKVSNTPIGRTIFVSQHFSGSGVCAQCHNELQDNTGKDVSIVSSWQTSMMANATRDPFWQAKVKSEINRTPQLKTTIQDKCTRCHAPMANEEARKQHDPVQAVFGEGILNKDNPYFDLSTNGVSCSLCHQISPNAPFGTDAAYSGHFAIDSFPTSTERLIYGPYQNVNTRPMQNMANFTPTYSEHIKTSELCASCHDLTTPYTDENGIILSQTVDDEFPEQMPYSEWLHSDFAQTKTCQQCHMERSDGVAIASRPRNNPKRDDFAQHSFLGANRLMLSILQEYREPLGVTATDFSISIAKAEKLLNEAAILEITQPSLQKGILSFNLNINSETGHKLPSGYPSRRVILHVTLRDANENIVFETGKVNSDGSVVELDSDKNLDQYEPHYQRIESSDQVQVYETIMQDYQDKITYTLLRAKSYVKDNRLLPKGFDKSTAPNKIKVRGLAASDENFIGGSDRVEFLLNNLTESSYTIEAELIYQTLGYAFAQDLFKEQDYEVTRFKQMFNASSLKSTSMGKVVVKITE
jgi:hypothetical protein